MESLPKETLSDPPIIIIDDLDDKSEVSENDIDSHEIGSLNDTEPAIDRRRSMDFNDSATTDLLFQREPVNEERRFLDMNDSLETVISPLREPTRAESQWETSNLNDSVATVLFDMKNEMNIQKQRSDENLTTEQQLNALIEADFKAAAQSVTRKRVSASAADQSNKENPPKKLCSNRQRSWSPKGINSATRNRRSGSRSQLYLCGVPECSFDGQNETNLRKHIVESHVDNSNEAFFCQHCSRVFPMVHNLIDSIFGHLRISHWNVF